MYCIGLPLLSDPAIQRQLSPTWSGFTGRAGCWVKCAATMRQIRYRVPGQFINPKLNRAKTIQHCQRGLYFNKNSVASLSLVTGALSLNITKTDSTTQNSIQDHLTRLDHLLTWLECPGRRCRSCPPHQCVQVPCTLTEWPPQECPHSPS